MIPEPIDSDLVVAEEKATREKAKAELSKPDPATAEEAEAILKRNTKTE